MEQRILEKAHELFMRYGIRSVSMDEIATQLGVSKKTIYQYYADKDALVDGVIGIEINRNECECQKCSTVKENAIHEIFLAVEMMQELLKVMNPVVIYDLEKYHPAAHKKLNEHKHKFMYDVIRNNLELGIREGLYREDIKPDILAKFRLASVFLVFNQDIFPQSKHNLVELIEEITDNFLYGIASTKGVKIIQKYKQQRQKK